MFKFVLPVYLTSLLLLPSSYGMKPDQGFEPDKGTSRPVHKEIVHFPPLVFSSEKRMTIITNMEPLTDRTIDEVGKKLQERAIGEISAEFRTLKGSLEELRKKVLSPSPSTPSLSRKQTIEGLKKRLMVSVQDVKDFFRSEDEEPFKVSEPDSKTIPDSGKLDNFFKSILQEFPIVAGDLHDLNNVMIQRNVTDELMWRQSDDLKRQFLKLTLKYQTFVKETYEHTQPIQLPAPTLPKPSSSQPSMGIGPIAKTSSSSSRTPPIPLTLPKSSSSQSSKGMEAIAKVPSPLTSLDSSEPPRKGTQQLLKEWEERTKTLSTSSSLSRSAPLKVTRNKENDPSEMPAIVSPVRNRSMTSLPHSLEKSEPKVESRSFNSENPEPQATTSPLLSKKNFFSSLRERTRSFTSSPKQSSHSGKSPPNKSRSQLSSTSSELEEEVVQLSGQNEVVQFVERWKLFVEGSVLSPLREMGHKLKEMNEKEGPLKDEE